MYYTFPPEITTKEFRTRITEADDRDYTVSLPAIIQTLFRGLAFEYLASVNLKPREKMLLIHFIDKCEFQSNETTRELAKKIGMSRQTVIAALQSLEKEGIINRNGDARIDLTPYISRMLRYKRVYDIYPEELSDLVKFFDRTEQDPVMTLEKFIGSIFSFTPEAPLVRFIRTCLLSGFDPEVLTDEQIHAYVEIIESIKYNDSRMLQAVSMSKDFPSKWQRTIEFYQDTTFIVKEEYVEPLRNALDKIEKILETPKKVADILVGEREEFYKQMAGYFPVLDIQEESDLERLKKVAEKIVETEEKVKEQLKRFMQVAETGGL